MSRGYVLPSLGTLRWVRVSMDQSAGIARRLMPRVMELVLESRSVNRSDAPWVPVSVRTPSKLNTETTRRTGLPAWGRYRYRALTPFLAHRKGPTI